MTQLIEPRARARYSGSAGGAAQNPHLPLTIDVGPQVFETALALPRQQRGVIASRTCSAEAAPIFVIQSASVYSVVSRVATPTPVTVKTAALDGKKTSWSWLAESSTAAFHGAVVATAPDTVSAAGMRVDRLARIQAALGLTMVDLADVLRVSRPQLYKWFDTAYDGALQDANRCRLEVVERLARRWRERSAGPLRAVTREPLANGGTVFDRLTAEPIDDDSVIATFDELAEKLKAQPKTRSRLLAEAGFTRRPSIRLLPSDE